MLFVHIQNFFEVYRLYFSHDNLLFENNRYRHIQYINYIVEDKNQKVKVVYLYRKIGKKDTTI